MSTMESSRAPCWFPENLNRYEKETQVNKVASKGSVVALLILLLLAGCSGSPEKRAGRWEATSEFGDFTFVIDETGTMITHMEHDLECKTGTMTDSFTMSGGPGSDLTDGKISLKRSMAGIPLIEWEGTFNASGSRASGTVWLFGRENCESKWQATKVD
jgi:hypothetical protein